MDVELVELLKLARTFNTYEPLAAELLKTAPLATKGGRRVVQLLAKHDIGLIDVALKYYDASFAASAFKPVAPAPTSAFKPVVRKIEDVPKQRKRHRVHHDLFERWFEFRGVDRLSLPHGGNQEEDGRIWITSEEANDIITKCGIVNKTFGELMDRCMVTPRSWCKTRRNMMIPPFSKASIGFQVTHVVDKTSKCALCGELLFGKAVSMCYNPTPLVDACHFHIPCAVIASSIFFIPELKDADVRCYCQCIHYDSKCVLFARVYAKKIHAVTKEDDNATVSEDD